MPLGSLGVDGFIRPRPGDVWFIRVRPGRCCVHSVSFDSFGFVRFIRGGRWVHLGAPWGSYPFRVVGIIWARPGRRWVHPKSFGSFKFVWLIPGVHLGAPWWFLGSFWVVADAPFGSLGSFVVIAFIRVRTAHHSQSLVSLGCEMGVIQGRWACSGAPCGSFGFIRGRLVRSGKTWGSFGVVGFICLRPGDRCVHSGTIGPFECALGIVGFI